MSTWLTRYGGCPDDAASSTFAASFTVSEIEGAAMRRPCSVEVRRSARLHGFDGPHSRDFSDRRSAVIALVRHAVVPSDDQQRPVAIALIAALDALVHLLHDAIHLGLLWKHQRPAKLFRDTHPSEAASD